MKPLWPNPRPPLSARKDPCSALQILLTRHQLSTPSPLSTPDDPESAGTYPKPDAYAATMEFVKVLLKAIIIPVVAVIVISIIAVFLIKHHRARKKEDRDIENIAFQPPPIQQWGTGPYQTSMPPVQKPEAVVYPMQPYQYPVAAGKTQA